MQKWPKAEYKHSEERKKDTSVSTKFILAMIAVVVSLKLEFMKIYKVKKRFFIAIYFLFKPNDILEI